MGVGFQGQNSADFHVHFGLAIRCLNQTAKDIESLLIKHGVTLKVTPPMLEQLATFYKFLSDYNHKLNLTRITGFQDFVVKHYVDCLYVAQLTKLPEPLIDMGTGPGFPGIPLKIVFPSLRIILVEGVQKRVEYLKEVRDVLKLQKLDIIGRNLDPKMHYPVQGVITRAVETCAATLGNAINCVQTEGRVILMKTPEIDPELVEAKEKWGSHYDLVEDIPYTLKGTPHKRRLVVFQKKKML